MSNNDAAADEATAKDAVLVQSVTLPADAPKVKGIDFNNHPNGISIPTLMSSMTHLGFQATNLGQAITLINEMRAWRDPITNSRPTIFLGYTSNLISSGLREIFRYLVEHRHVDVIVTTAGGIEEDFIKCLAPTYMSPEGFAADGKKLRSQGLNRIGNLLVPNSNYCAFEDWVVPILDKMLEEQESAKERVRTLGDQAREEDIDFNWTPSKVVQRLGREIKNKESVYYWAAKNDIPVFCPALTDGSLGDMLYFHTFKSSPSSLKIDIVEDIRKINTLAVRAPKTGCIILGGGVVKHHICNANLMRNGADWAVYVNTGQEFDGSDAGARPDEAVSWGKIRGDGKSVKVYADATIVFPLMVAATFARPAGES